MAGIGWQVEGPRLNEKRVKAASVGSKIHEEGAEEVTAGLMVSRGRETARLDSGGEGGR